MRWVIGLLLVIKHLAQLLDLDFVLVPGKPSCLMTTAMSKWTTNRRELGVEGANQFKYHGRAGNAPRASRVTWQMPLTPKRTQVIIGYACVTNGSRSISNHSTTDPGRPWDKELPINEWSWALGVCGSGWRAGRTLWQWAGVSVPSLSHGHMLHWTPCALL